MPTAADVETIEGLAHPLGRAGIGPFRLTGLLGEGGMAVVFRGFAPDGAPAAVKVIRAALVGEHARRRFAREACIRIDHPNIVKVLDAGTDPDGTPYIAFELLEGVSLRDRLQAHRATIEETIDYGVQICRGLEAAHAHHIVHRDLKPANLFLAADGTLKLLDFGVAHMASTETQLTASGHVVGTPAYLSPEQARGEPSTDPRIDVWAIGAVLYEALVGAPPFERESSLATMLATIVEPLTPPSQRTTVPPDLDRVICRALEKDKNKRWPSARALREALERVDVAQTAEHVARVSERPSLIPIGEQRVVVVMLAEGVVDRQALEQAVRARDGELLPLAGEKAVGLFGHRRWDGDEVVRAAQAALEARGQALRLSLASGRVAQTGAQIAGDALRDAERGCAASVRGVAVSASIVRELGERAHARSLGEGLFELRDLGAMRATRASLMPAPSRPILGRTTELAYLASASGGALAGGHATSVLVSGPPGIGKTRLLREHPLWRSPGSVTVLSGAGQPQGRDASFSLLGSVLRALLDDDRVEQATFTAALVAVFRDRERVEEHAPYLGELVGVAFDDSPAIRAARSDPQLMRDRIRLAFVDLLEPACRRGGLALLLEDVQWADATSIELVEELLQRLEDAPFFVAASARPEVGERFPALFASGHLLHLRLRGLAAEDVAALAERSAERTLPATLLRDIAERTAGNPLFVEQIVLALSEEHAITDYGTELPLPLSVEAAVQSRLDHLPSEEKELVKRAAVLDPPFGGGDLEALGLDAPASLVPALARRGLLERVEREVQSEPALRFKSDLLRQVAYRMLTDDVRRELHRRVADHLRGRGDVDAAWIARHYEEAGESIAAASSYGDAVAQAARRCDTDSVLRCAERALALGLDDVRRFELHMACAEACRFSGQRARWGAELEEAVAHAKNSVQRARARVEQIAWLQRTGRQTDALASGPDALDEARASGDPEVIAMALARVAAARIYSGDVAGAAELIAEAEGMLGAIGPKPAAYVAAISAELAGARGELGARGEAWRLAVRRYLAAGDMRLAASVENNLADLYNRMGMYDEAAAALRDAGERGRRLGYPLLEGYANANLGYALSRLGEHDEALRALAHAERIAHAAQDGRLELIARVYADRARLLRGDAADEVEERARADAHRAAEGQHRWLDAVASVVAGRAALQDGDVSSAQELAERAMAIRDELGGLEEDEAEVFLLFAAVREALGDAEGAAETLRRGAERVRAVAEGIRDPVWRERFLAQVEAHRTILGLAQ